jgi:hypothetical protein
VPSGDSWGFEIFSSEHFQEQDLSRRAEKAGRKVVLDEGAWEMNQEDGRRARLEGSDPKSRIGGTNDSPGMKAAGGSMDAMCAGQTGKRPQAWMDLERGLALILADSLVASGRIQRGKSKPDT